LAACKFEEKLERVLKVERERFWTTDYVWDWKTEKQLIWFVNF